MVVNLDHPPHVWLWMHEDKGQLSGHLAANRTQEQLHLKIRLETFVKNLLVQTMMKRQDQGFLQSKNCSISKVILRCKSFVASCFDTLVLTLTA